MERTLNKARVRAYARLLETGMRSIDEIDKAYRVAIYVELIAAGKIDIEDVDARYIEDVRIEMQ